MMKRRKKGFLALVLCFAFVFGYVPGMKNLVWADKGDAEVEVVRKVELTYTPSSGTDVTLSYPSLKDAYNAAVELINNSTDTSGIKAETPLTFTLYDDAEIAEDEAFVFDNRDVKFNLNNNKLEINGSLTGVTGVVVEGEKAGTLEINGSIDGGLQSFNDSIININSGSVGYISADAGTFNISGGTVNGLLLENDNKTDVNVTISGDAKINSPKPEEDAIDIEFSNEEGRGGIQLTLKGGYYATDPCELLPAMEDHFKFGEYCDIEYYDKLSEKEQAEWAKVADPEKYPYRVVDTRVGAIVYVEYKVKDDSEWQEFYCKSLTEMAEVMEAAYGTLDDVKSLDDYGFLVFLLDDITVASDEEYIVKNLKDNVTIALYGHTLTVNGKLVFNNGNKEFWIDSTPSEEPGKLVVNGTVNSILYLGNVQDKIDITAGAIEEINNFGSILTVNGGTVDIIRNIRFEDDLNSNASTTIAGGMIGGVLNKYGSLAVNGGTIKEIVSYDKTDVSAGIIEDLFTPGGKTNITGGTIDDLIVYDSGVTTVSGNAMISELYFGITEGDEINDEAAVSTKGVEDIKEADVKAVEEEEDDTFLLTLKGGFYGEDVSEYLDEENLEGHFEIGEGLDVLDYNDEDTSEANKKEWTEAGADPKTYGYHVTKVVEDEITTDDDDDTDDDEEDDAVDDNKDDVEDDTNNGKKEGKVFTVSGPDSITLGEGATYTIKSDGEPEDSYEQYIGTDADGNPIQNTAKKGSTIITISADELAKLGSGKHTLTFKFKNGSVSTTLMINEPAKDSEVTPATDETKTNVDSTAQTGDSFDPVLVTVIMLIALGSLAGLAIYKKKEDNR